MLHKRLWHEDGEGGCCHHHEGGEHHCCGHHHHEEAAPAADRTQAMIQYMINHNAQHAMEIRGLEEGVLSEEAIRLMEQAVKAMAISCDCLQDALNILQQMTPAEDSAPGEA